MVFFQKVVILMLWTYGYENNYKRLQNIKGAGRWKLRVFPGWWHTAFQFHRTRKVVLWNTAALRKPRGPPGAPATSVLESPHCGEDTCHSDPFFILLFLFKRGRVPGFKICFCSVPAAASSTRPESVGWRGHFWAARCVPASASWRQSPKMCSCRAQAQGQHGWNKKRISNSLPFPPKLSHVF